MLLLLALLLLLIVVTLLLILSFVRAILETFLLFFLSIHFKLGFLTLYRFF